MLHLKMITNKVPFIILVLEKKNTIAATRESENRVRDEFEMFDLNFCLSMAFHRSVGKAAGVFI